MSLYELNRICHRVTTDPAFRDGLRADPAGALAALELSAGERADLLAGAVGPLYRRGVHPVLLCRLGEHGLFGLDRRSYARQITAEAITAEAITEPERP